MQRVFNTDTSPNKKRRCYLVLGMPILYSDEGVDRLPAGEVAPGDSAVSGRCLALSEPRPTCLTKNLVIGPLGPDPKPLAGDEGREN